MTESNCPITDRGMVCKICGAPTALFGETVLLRKYLVRYFQCTRCGFIQTEQPYWLKEAYSSAITAQDVGIIARNMANAEVVAAVIGMMYPYTERALDFGGGHGVFVRMMRDRGYRFEWYDAYASNDYARGFEFAANQNYDFVTAFEVLEHLVDPMAELSRMMAVAPHLLVSTLPLPVPAPQLPDWWYYSPITGQHVSFYTRGSLEFIADYFQRSLMSNGPFHLFTTDVRSAMPFRIATRPKLAWLINRFRRRPSLIASDHDFLSQ